MRKRKAPAAERHSRGLRAYKRTENPGQEHHRKREIEMCGRYTLQHPGDDELMERYGMDRMPLHLEPFINIGPGNRAPAIMNSGQLTTAPPRAGRMNWGIAPRWGPGRPLINARSETVFEKPTFRDLARHNRCLLPATGFYERGPDRELKCFDFQDGRIFSLAGIYQARKHGERVERSFVILTTPPNDLVRKVHDRMPLILTPDAEAEWLNPNTQIKDLQALFLPIREEGMTIQPGG